MNDSRLLLPRRRRTLFRICVAVSMLLVVPGVCISLPWFMGFGPGAADFSLALPGGFTFYRTSSLNQAICGPSPSMGGATKPATPICVEGHMKYLGWNERIIICQLQAASATATSTSLTGEEWAWWIIDMARNECLGPLPRDKARDICLRHGLNFDTLRHFEEYRPKAKP